MKKKWKTYGKISDYSTFSLLRKVKAKMKHDFNTYIINTENNIKTDTKYFWSYIKALKKNTGIPNIICYQDREARNGADIRNLFAEHFKFKK